MGPPRALSLFLLATSVLASTMVLHESISSIPSGFTTLGSPSPTLEISLLIALVQSNLTGLSKVVNAVSTPSSPSYGQYLTAAEVAQYVKPPVDSVSAVFDWISPNVASVKTFSPAGDILQISLAVAQAERVFNTTFATYTHSPSGQQMIRALNYSLPSTIRKYVHYVHPIIAFTPPPRSFSRETLDKRTANLHYRQLAPCQDIVLPECIQQYYGIPNKTISGSLTNSIGVQGFNAPSLPEYANEEDLATFLHQFRPDLSETPFKIALLNSAKNKQNNSGNGLEGQIDIQYTVGVAGDVPTTYVLDQSGDDAAISYMDTIHWLLSQAHPPTVFTTSYGNEESELTRSVATSVCNGYMQLAAMGISMIFASGDGGAADNQFNCTSFVPMFPPTCPYVTAVGGTFFQPPTAFSSSAGGFSNYFSVPNYQTADTSAYLKTLQNNYKGMYNPNGRGFPDVASEWEVFIVNDGSVTSVGGTSCASPIFASVIALANDRLIAAGKPVLGFLNPFLYGTGKAGFNDVAVGQSSGCSGPTGGWNATMGWDPISGLGTPDFRSMMAALGIHNWHG